VGEGGERAGGTRRAGAGEQGQEEEQRVRMSGSKIYRKPIAGYGCVETKREEGGNSTLY